MKKKNGLASFGPERVARNEKSWQKPCPQERDFSGSKNMERPFREQLENGGVPLLGWSSRRHSAKAARVREVVEVRSNWGKGGLWILDPLCPV